MKEVYAIGQITEDLQPVPHMGGAVAYAGVAALRLGMDVHVITKAPPEHPYLKELSTYGVGVEQLPGVAGQPAAIPSFENYYDKSGRRRQIAHNTQGGIGMEDLPDFPAIPDGSIVLVAPVLDEVNPALFPALARDRQLTVLPQGYFRQAGEDGQVRQHPWQAVDSLRHAGLAILSDEDLTFDDDHMDEALSEHIRELCPLVVLTRGKAGLTIYQHDKTPIDVKAFAMEPGEQLSSTGAGDSCAAAFVWQYARTQNTREAGTFGVLYAALKLMGIGGSARGVAALPSLAQIRQFIDANPKRMTTFMQSNQLSTLRLPDK